MYNNLKSQYKVCYGSDLHQCATRPQCKFEQGANLNKGKTNPFKSMCIFFNRDKALFGIDLDSANVHGSENPTSIIFQETPRHK